MGLLPAWLLYIILDVLHTSCIIIHTNTIQNLEVVLIHGYILVVISCLLDGHPVVTLSMLRLQSSQNLYDPKGPVNPIGPIH